ncbi:WD repeat-containing protein 75 [Geranomyces variabilis]|nr:WD repeat-containing protein 75 [Geranomyces variabilis]
MPKPTLPPAAPASARKAKVEPSTSARKAKSAPSSPTSAGKVKPAVNGVKLNGKQAEVKVAKVVKSPKPNGTPAPPPLAPIVNHVDSVATLASKPSRKGARGARRYRTSSVAHAAHVAVVQQPVWKPSSLVGGSVGKNPVVFSRDSTFYFCVAGSRIKVHSATTGLLIRTLAQPVESSDILTAVEVHAEDPQLIFTASSTGTLRMWSLESGKVEKKWEIGENITQIRVNRHEPDYIYVITTSVALPATGKGNSSLYKFYMRKKTKQLLYRSKKQPLLSLDIAADGSYIATHTLSACTLISAEVPTDVYHCFSEIPITSLAIHPTAQYLAAGDFTGKITLWHCGSVFAKEKPISSVLHWHPHQVNGVAFSADGEYLLSGGDEAVLVVWQLSTRRKQFLPRLSTPIRSLSISPDQTMYAVTHGDNSVRVIASATMITKFISAGPPPYDASSRRPWQMIREPRDDSVAIFGLGGSLQFYDVTADQRLQQLEVTSTESSAKVKGRPSVNVAVVTHVAFAVNNEWMITVDDRLDSTASMWESRLKFWNYKPDSATYVMNTRVDRPHKGHVTGVAISGEKKSAVLRAATTGSDKYFRVWNLLPPSAGNQETWGCLYSGAYRDMVPEGASFSSDNSLVAVAFHQVVTLWSASGNLLHSVMTAPSPVRNVDFLGGSGYVISYSGHFLHVWDLLKGALWWSLRLNIAHLAVDNASCHFAVITHEEISRPRKTKSGLVSGIPEISSRILVFEADSPTPVATFVRRGRCLSSTFLPKASGTELVVLNDVGELEVFVQPRAAVSVPIVGRRIEVAPQTTALSSLYGQVKAPSSRSDRPVAPRHASVANAALQAPAHAHPPPTRFFLSTMELLLEPRKDTTTQAAMDEIDTAENANGTALVNGWPASDDQEQDDAEAYVKLEPRELRQMFKRVLTALEQ